MLELAVAVTGASGFLASDMIRQMQGGVCEKGPLSFRVGRIVGIDLVSPDKPIEGVEYLIGSVTDAAFIDEAFKNINVVFHCCSLVDFGQRSLNQIMEINLEGTKIVTASCKKNSVDYIVYTSSCEAVSWRTKDNTNIKEDAEKPENLEDFLGSNYGFSKGQAEKHLKSWSEFNKSKVGVVRPRSVFGPNDKYLVPNVLDNIKQKNFVVFFGSESDKQTANYVENVAFIHLFCLHHMILDESSDTFFAFNSSLPEKVEKLQSFHDLVVEFSKMIGAPRESVGDWFLPAWLIIFLVMVFDRFNQILGLRYNTLINEQTIRSTALPMTLNTEKLVDAGIMEFEHCLIPHAEAMLRTRQWVQSQPKFMGSS